MMKSIFAMTLAFSLGAMAAIAAEGDPKPKPSVPPGAPPAGVRRPIPEAFKKYDKNGDGILDEAENKALRDDRRNKLMKKYDKNGDGKLDETERQAMMEERKKERDELLKKRQADGGPGAPKPTPPAPPSDKK
ncbi:MAG: EF-hand domain-containing protein [Verrucomicrobia bacterium]|nr:EF-hand domain-containing protein [Verrucomicrobiota bacterium]